MAIPLDTMFVNQHANLVAHAALTAGSIINDTQRWWMMPAIASGNPLDPTWMGLPYSRSALNFLYPFIMNLNGSTGDAMACRVQADYLSAQERAFRLRHASPVRCLLHAASRRAGHADSNLGPLARTVIYVRDLINSGIR